MSRGLVRPTRRVAIEVEGLRLDRWTDIAVDRSVGEISGSFVLALRDDARNISAWPWASFGEIGPLVEGKPCRITIDDEPVLVGHVEDWDGGYDEGSVDFFIAGRDLTGDLVDCAAAPEGPVEYRGLTCHAFAERLCKPFGIPVRCDVDPGEPFDKCSCDAAETVVSAIEKHTRQRKLLVTSDGVEGLVLTRSGKERAAGDIVAPGPGVRRARGSRSQRERFSDYFVKGQAEKAGGTRSRSAAMTSGTKPGSRSDGAAQEYRARNGGNAGAAAAYRARNGGSASREGRGVENSGRARDPEIRRWRPTVAQMKSQESAGGAQEQAEWMMRVARGKGLANAYALEDWRASPSGNLWMPNTILTLTDRYLGIENEERLIDAVGFRYGEQGAFTELALVGPEAYEEA